MTDDTLLPEEPTTFRKERVREDRYEPGDPAAGASAVAMVLLKSYGVADASNGANIGARLQVDAAYASDFEDLMGESTYIFRVGTKDYGECRVMVVNSRVDAENRSQTVVSLKWSADQKRKTRDLVELVGTSFRVELWLVELPIFGARAE